MKLAVTYSNGQIFQHFGHTESFKIYDIEDSQVKSSEVVPTEGSGHGALAGFLGAHGVEALICGGIGGGAINALGESNIQVYAGVSGSADEAVTKLLNGTLSFAREANCSHHDHEHGEGHSCGEHHNCSHQC